MFASKEQLRSYCLPWIEGESVTSKKSQRAPRACRRRATGQEDPDPFIQSVILSKNSARMPLDPLSCPYDPLLALCASIDPDPPTAELVHRALDLVPVHALVAEHTERLVPFTKRQRPLEVLAGRLCGPLPESL